KAMACDDSSACTRKVSSHTRCTSPLRLACGIYGSKAMETSRTFPLAAFPSLPMVALAACAREPATKDTQLAHYLSSDDFRELAGRPLCSPSSCPMPTASAPGARALPVVSPLSSVPACPAAQHNWCDKQR